MSQDRSAEEIRAEKRESLREQIDGADKATDGSGPTDAPSEPVHVNGVAELDDVTTEYDVVLVDFYADWCGPCQMLEPTVESIAAETDAAVAKVDVDANQQLAAQHGVRGVPTLAIFAGGEKVQEMVGAQQREALVAAIERHQ